MLRKWLTGICWGAAVLLSAGAVIGAESAVTVFAAASTTDAMADLGKAFTAETGIKVKFNLGSTGSLVRQMEEKAPVDILIAAAKNWSDYAVKHKLLDPASTRDFLTNELVVVVPKDSTVKPFAITAKLDFPALFKGRLSVGDPAHVPAGKYAQAALRHFGWEKALTGRLLPAMDVRAALLAVEMGEAEMGIVYGSDAAKSGKVKTVAVFPVGSFPKIVYVSGLCPGSSDAAKRFYEFMLGKQGMAVFKKYGFAPLNP